MNTTFEKTRAGICLVLVIFFVTAGSVAFGDRTLLLAGDPAKGGSTHHAAPRDAMIAALASANPNPSMGDEAQTFDRLVGTWDAEFTFFRDDGTVFHKKGELLSAGSWMVAQYRTSGSAIRPKTRRNARLGRRFGSSIQHSSSGVWYL